MRAIVCLALVVALNAHAQRIEFIPWLAEHALTLDQQSSLPDGTPITVTQFRFYAGRFLFYRGGKVISRNDAYHLIDAADPTSFVVDLDAKAAAVGDSITFMMGVDSLTNVSGAFGDDLDPTKGMYWTWNSGYINLKLEGSSAASPYPSHEFELHLGGYSPPYATAQRVALYVTGSGPWPVHVDIASLLAAADIRTNCNVMSSGEKAVALSRIAATIFSYHAGIEH